MAVVGTLLMGCSPGSPGCGQPPPPDGYIAVWSNILIVEAAVVIVVATAATLWWRHRKMVADSSPWPEGGYWASYRRRFKWTALAVFAVTLALLAQAGLGSGELVHRVNISVMFYADALLVIGLPLSLVVAALPAPGHRSTRSTAT